MGSNISKDIIYGNRQQIQSGNIYAKKVGFTYSVLNNTFAEAGFKSRYGGRMPALGGELNIVAFKQFGNNCFLELIN